MGQETFIFLRGNPIIRLFRLDPKTTSERAGCTCECFVLRGVRIESHFHLVGLVLDLQLHGLVGDDLKVFGQLKFMRLHLTFEFGLDRALVIHELVRREMLVLGLGVLETKQLFGGLAILHYTQVSERL